MVACSFLFDSIANTYLEEMSYQTLQNLDKKTGKKFPASLIARTAFGDSAEIKEIYNRFLALKSAKLKVLGSVTNIQTEDVGRVSENHPINNYVLLYPRFFHLGVTKLLLLVGMSSEFLNLKCWQSYLMRRYLCN